MSDKTSSSRKNITNLLYQKKDLNSALTIQELFYKLRGETFTFSEEEQQKLSMLLIPSRSKKEEETSEILQGLIGISAWVSSLFFFVFLGLVFGSAFTTEGVSLVLGAFFSAISIVLQGSPENMGKQKENIFQNQLAFVFGFVGRILFAFGMFILFESAEMVVIGAIVLEIFFFCFYPNSLMKTLSVLLIANGILFLLFEFHVSYLIHFLIIFVAGAMLWHFEQESCWLHSKKYYLFFTPVKLALPLVLLNFTIFSFVAEFPIQEWFISTLGLLVLLVYYQFYLLKKYKITQVKTILLPPFATILIAIPTYNTPSILATLLIFLVAFHRGAQEILVISIVFMSISLSVYYYNMDTTLLIKSLILISTGAIFLGFRYFFFSNAQRQEVV